MARAAGVSVQDVQIVSIQTTSQARPKGPSLFLICRSSRPFAGEAMAARSLIHCPPFHSAPSPLLFHSLQSTVAVQTKVNFVSTQARSRNRKMGCCSSVFLAVAEQNAHAHSCAARPHPASDVMRPDAHFAVFPAATAASRLPPCLRR